MKASLLSSLQTVANKLAIKGLTKLCQKSIKTSVNYASNTFVGNGSKQIITSISKTGKALGVFKSSLKSSVIVGVATFAVGTIFDCIRGKNPIESVV